MECRTARLLLELTHPHAAELDATEAELLHAHLVGCAECGSRAREERRLDAPLAAAMKAVPVPGGLRDRLGERLRTERAAAARPWRFRLAGVAAAAAVLVAVGVWWSLRPPPGLDLAALHADPVPRNAAEVEEYFARRRVRTVAPPGFNYGHLAVCHLVEFEGQPRVPHLLFLRNGDFAEVYILSAKQFDAAATLAQQRIDSGGWTVEVQAHPSDPQVFYLIKHTGSLQRFLTEEGRTTT